MAVFFAVLASGCSDPTLPLKERIKELEAHNTLLERRLVDGEKEVAGFEEEIAMERHAHKLLVVELEGVNARLEERGKRLQERDEMVALSSQHVEIVRQNLEAVRLHLTDLKDVHGGQSNLIEKAKAYTDSLKRQITARDEEIREKDSLIRDLERDLERRNEDIERLRRERINPPDKPKGLAGPSDRKVRRLGE